MLYNLRRADRKGGKGCLPYDGPYVIDKALPNGVYQLKTMDGRVLKQKQNGCNLKKFHDRQEEGKTDETEIQIGKQIIDKVDGKKMNQKQKKLIEGNENETNSTDEAETHASKQLDGTQNDSSLKTVLDEQESEGTKSDDKTNVKDVQFERDLAPARNWYCPTTPTWRKQKCEQFQLPTPNPNSERRKKGALGAPLKVVVIEGDGNCLFRAISYEVTLSQDHHQFFHMAVCGILQNNLYQSQFESRHLNKMNVSDYLMTTQMEVSGVWGTEVEVIALATLLKTTIAIYYHPPGAKGPLWHHYSPLCSSAETSVCIYMYLHNTGNHFNRIKTVTSGM